MSTPRIIHDDQHIRVIHQPGQSDFLLITLGDLLTEPNGHRFFADTPVQKSNMAAIGIVAKGANFYPTASILAATPAINALTAAHPERILYGGSMGGYGALKHSRRLGASLVIALCPQWSIDPAESEGNFPGWPHLMTPALAGMGISPTEYQGAAYIFADMSDQVDNFQARMIRRTNPAATIINVPLVEHHVTGVFAGTQNLQNLITACRHHRLQDLLSLTRRLRQNSPRRLTTLFQRGLARHPRLTYPIMATRPSPDPIIGPLAAPHVFNAAATLTSQGNPAAALSYLETYRHELRDPADIIAAGALLGHLSGREILLTTHHNTILVYDLARRRCTQARHPIPRSQTPVRLRATAGTAQFHALAGGMELPLVIGESAHLTTHPESPSTQNPTFQIGARYNGAVTFNAAGRFLSAEPDGAVKCDRDTPYEWEHFRFSI